MAAKIVVTVPDGQMCISGS